MLVQLRACEDGCLGGAFVYGNSQWTQERLDLSTLVTRRARPNHRKVLLSKGLLANAFTFIIGSSAIRRWTGTRNLLRRLILKLGQCLQQWSDLIHLMSLLLIQVLLFLHGSEHFIEDSKVFIDVLFLRGEIDELLLSLTICTNNNLARLKLIHFLLTRSISVWQRGAKLESDECVERVKVEREACCVGKRPNNSLELPIQVWIC